MCSLGKPGARHARAHTRFARTFLLPYEAVRTVTDPDRALLEFLHATYRAAAERGGWDRAALEDDLDR